MAFTSVAQYKPRSLDELTKVQDPAWPEVRRLFDSAKNKVEILEVDPAKAMDELSKMQVSVHSFLGGIIFNTGGVLIDNGWIRILSSGSLRLTRRITSWNEGKAQYKSGEAPPWILIADDAIGGFFLLNGGGLGADIGTVYYLSPDNLEYEPLGLKYADFIVFCCNNDLNKFYEGYRWATWREDLAKLGTDRAFQFYPFLFTKEGKDIEKDVRNPIPMEELYSFTMEMRVQLKGKK